MSASAATAKASSNATTTVLFDNKVNTTWDPDGNNVLTMAVHRQPNTEAIGGALTTDFMNSGESRRPCWSFANNKELIVSDLNVVSPLSNSDLYLLTIEFTSDSKSRNRTSQHRGDLLPPPLTEYGPPPFCTQTSQPLTKATTNIPPRFDPLSEVNAISSTASTTNATLTFPSESASCTSDSFIFNLIESFSTSTTPLAVRYIRILSALATQETLYDNHFVDGGNTNNHSIVAESNIDSNITERHHVRFQPVFVSKATSAVCSLPQKYTTQIVIDCSNLHSKGVSISTGHQHRSNPSYTAKATVGSLSAIKVSMCKK